MVYLLNKGLRQCSKYFIVKYKDEIYILINLGPNYPAQSLVKQ